MAAHSLLSINSCSSSLRPLHSSLIFPTTTNLHTALTAPSRGRRCLPLILSEMQSERNGSSPTTTNDDTKSSLANNIGQNTLAQSTISTDQGLNLQMFSLANIPPWAKFVLGSVVLLAIPFCRKALRIQDVTKAAETVAETVEMVAEAAEKVALEVAEMLPNGRLKEAALNLEKIALLVDKSAEVTESVIDKVDDVVELLGAALKPNINGEHQMNSADKVVMRITTSELKEDLH